MYNQYKKELGYSFLTNHALVMLTLASNPDISIRSLSDELMITERAVHGMLTDLLKDGYITITKVGRNNRYEVNLDQKLKHAKESEMTARDLFDAASGTYRKLLSALSTHMNPTQQPRVSQ